MSSRSSLYRWMQQNHDELAAALAEAGRPNWKAITAEFAADGLTDADGNPPSQEAVRQTWWKVRKGVEATRAKRQTASPPARPVVAKVDTAADDRPTPDNPFGFAPGKPKARA